MPIERKDMTETTKNSLPPDEDGMDSFEDEVAH
jgi:hypothetical protein